MNRMQKQDFIPIDMGKSGKWMRFLCRIKGITVKQICSDLGISCPQSVYAWFNGRTMPSLDNLYAMSQMLKVPMNELILDTKEVIPEGLRRRKTPGQIRQIYYCYLMVG